MNWTDALLVIAVAGFLVIPILVWAVVALVIIGRRRTRFYEDFEKRRSELRRDLPW